MDSSLSFVSDDSEDPTLSRANSSPVQVEVNSLSVQGGTGIHNGNLTNLTVNQFIVPKGDGGELSPELVKELLTEAIQYNDVKRTFREPTKRFLLCRAEMAKRWLGRKKIQVTGILIFTCVVVTISSVLYFLFSGEEQIEGGEECFVSTNSSLRIVCRAAWGAVNATAAMDTNTLPLAQVIVCHTVTPECSTEAQCITCVQTMQQIAQNQSGFLDIPYNFLVGGDGRVYEGRGWDIVGSHTVGYNWNTLGVAFIGTYTSKLPSATMIEGFSELMEMGLNLNKISQDYTLVGYCQLRNKASPGRALIENMTSWPHFDSSLGLDYC